MYCWQKSNVMIHTVHCSPKLVLELRGHDVVLACVNRNCNSMEISLQMCQKSKCKPEWSLGMWWNFSVPCSVLSPSITVFLPNDILHESTSCCLLRTVPDSTSASAPLFLFPIHVIQLCDDGFETGFSMSLTSSVFPFIQACYSTCHPLCLLLEQGEMDESKTKLLPPFLLKLSGWDPQLVKIIVPSKL